MVIADIIVAEEENDVGPPIGVLQGSPGHANGSSEIYNHDSTPLPQRRAFSSSLVKDPLLAYGNLQGTAFIGPNGQLLDNRMTSLTIEDSNLYGLEKESPVALLTEVDEDTQLVGYMLTHHIQWCSVIASRILHEICLLLGELATVDTLLY